MYGQNNNKEIIVYGFLSMNDRCRINQRNMPIINIVERVGEEGKSQRNKTSAVM